MRRSNGFRVVAFGAAALLMALAGVGPARAACTVDPCTGGGSALFDCDRDGLTDLEECSGLVVAGTTYPRCGTGECLDPRKSDLFVKFEKAAPSSAYTELNITDAAAFGLITQPVGGLAMRVHVLPGATVLPPIGTNTQNAITARMSALSVREVRGPSTSCPITSALGLINGVTSVGAAGVAQVFTQRIIDHVNCVYQAAGVANPNASAAATADKVKMIRHTTAHETTHANRLAPESVERFGGNHYKTGTGCVMDQASTYSTRNGVVTFATPQVYCGPDQAAILAGETALGRIQCEDPNNVLDQDNFTTVCLSPTP
jgi:hypothetical protein